MFYMCRFFCSSTFMDGSLLLTDIFAFQRVFIYKWDAFGACMSFLNSKCFEMLSIWTRIRWRSMTISWFLARALQILFFAFWHFKSEKRRKWFGEDGLNEEKWLWSQKRVWCDVEDREENTIGATADGRFTWKWGQNVIKSKWCGSSHSIFFQTTTSTYKTHHSKLQIIAANSKSESLFYYPNKHTASTHIVCVRAKLWVRAILDNV